MNPFLAVPLLALLASSTPAATPAPAHEAFAVVELFTSEGCSSCPPADRLLSTIAAETQQDHRNVMVLAFHVDYWNSPAWSDRFSDAVYSERQRSYDQALRDEVYTPQAVVNGRAVFVGSDAGALRRAVADALARPAKFAVRIDVRRATGALEVGYHVTGAPSGALVSAALTESGLRTHVKGGENAGRDLTHDGVVRVLVTAPLEAAGAGVVHLHDDAASSGPRRVIVLVQDPKTLEVLGATSAQL